MPHILREACLQHSVCTVKFTAQNVANNLYKVFLSLHISKKLTSRSPGTKL